MATRKLLTFRLRNTTSLKTRLTGWNVFFLATMLIGMGSALRYTVQHNIQSSVDRHLTGEANRLKDITERRMGHPFPPPPPPPFDGDHDDHNDHRDPYDHPPGPPRLDQPRPPTFFDMMRFGHLRGVAGPDVDTHDWLAPRIVSLVPDAGPWPNDEKAWDVDAGRAAAQGHQIFSDTTISGEHYRVFSFPLTRNGRIIAYGQVARSMTVDDLEMNRLSVTMLTLLPITLLAAALGGAFLTDRALRPVRQITHAASTIEAGNLSGRLNVVGSDEFAELAATFNGMLDRLEGSFQRLERAFEQQRRFTADASHELRTPLSIIKANSSLALRSERTALEYRNAIQAIDNATDRTTRIVQDLLLLASSDAGQIESTYKTVSLIEVIAQARDLMDATPGAPIDVRIEKYAAFFGDSDSIVRVLCNLLENARRHTPSDGSITVTGTTRDREVLIVIRDTGSGISPEHLSHIGERFYRADESRARNQGGTGLGIAICMSIIDAHQGHISFASLEGTGTTVTLTLPMG